MEGQACPGPLPIAALSLTAFAPTAVPQTRTARPRQAAAPAHVSGIHDGPRSHPIVARLPAAELDEAESQPRDRSKADPLTRLLSAVPAALGRLLTAPVHEAAFSSSPRLSDARVFPSALRRRAARGGGARPAGGGGRQAVVVWFRNDLRLHDNPTLEQACREGSSVLPVYVFDPRDYGKTPSGFSRTGPARTRFILDAVADLRSRLQAAGSELVVRVGRPEEVLAGLARDVGAGAVFCQSEATAEEAQVEGRVKAALERDGCQLRPTWGGTLYHLEDLPFRLESMPTSYAEFRSRVASLAVRPVVESEGAVKGLPKGNSIEPGNLPTLEQLGATTAPAPGPAPGTPAGGAGSGFGAPLAGVPAGPPLRGGESEALRHLQAFVAELKSSLSASQSRQPAKARSSTAATPAAGPAPAPSSAFSCRISPWLALGCLSPRRMYHEMRKQLGAAGAAMTAGQQQQQQVVAGSAAVQPPTGAGPANWLLFELLWRDFFRFVTQKYTIQSLATTVTGGKATAALKAAPVRLAVGAGAVSAAPALAVA